MSRLHPLHLDPVSWSENDRSFHSNGYTSQHILPILSFELPFSPNALPWAVWSPDSNLRIPVLSTYTFRLGLLIWGIMCLWPVWTDSVLLGHLKDSLKSRYIYIFFIWGEVWVSQVSSTVVGIIPSDSWSTGPVGQCWAEDADLLGLIGVQWFSQGCSLLLRPAIFSAPETSDAEYSRGQWCQVLLGHVVPRTKP